MTVGRSSVIVMTGRGYSQRQGGLGSIAAHPSIIQGWGNAIAWSVLAVDIPQEVQGVQGQLRAGLHAVQTKRCHLRVERLR